MAKRSVGAPSKYKPEYCDKLIFHMNKGFSFESFAAEVDVDRDTIYEWAKVHKQFSDAKKKGSSKCLRWWEEQGITGLYSVTTRDGDGGSSTIAINSAIYCFNMKNRFGWRDKQDIEVDAKVKTESSELEKVKELLARLNQVKSIE